MIKGFEKYLLLEKRFSKHTVTAYIKDLKQFYEFAQITENEVVETHHVIRGWIVSMLDNGITNRTINRKISSLKTFYRYLKRQNLVKNSPLEKIISPKTSKDLPEFVQETDFDSLDELFGDDFSGIRDRVIFEMLYLTGMRRAELVSLHNSQIDMSNRQVKVIGKRQKERLIPLTDYMANLILKYINKKEELEEFDKLAFILTDKGKPAYDKFIYRVVQKYLTQLTSLNKRSPHVLRHTFATHLLNNGADLNAIKELLGHANLSATQVYTHNSFEKLNNIYKQAHPRA
ncbi:MAG: tyrosine-type recombinase/integrase [Bacteroidales bacterium]|nr:tyrosine-type recombinase/integrase [Bacteroidales bacterium]